VLYIVYRLISQQLNVTFTYLQAWVVILYHDHTCFGYKKLSGNFLWHYSQTLKNPWVLQFCIDTHWLLLWGIYYRRTWMNLSLSGMSIPYEKIVKPCLHMVVQSTYMICQQCMVRIGRIALRRLMSDAHIGAQDHLQHFDSDMWAHCMLHESKPPPRFFPTDYKNNISIILNHTFGITVDDINHGNCRGIYLRLVQLVTALVQQDIPVCSMFQSNNTSGSETTDTDTEGDSD